MQKSVEVYSSWLGTLCLWCSLWWILNRRRNYCDSSLSPQSHCDTGQWAYPLWLHASSFIKYSNACLPGVTVPCRILHSIDAAGLEKRLRSSRRGPRFPKPTLGKSQPLPVIPGESNTSGVQGHLYPCAHTHTQTHVYTCTCLHNLKH